MFLRHLLHDSVVWFQWIRCPFKFEEDYFFHLPVDHPTVWSVKSEGLFHLLWVCHRWVWPSWPVLIPWPSPSSPPSLPPISQLCPHPRPRLFEHRALVTWSVVVQIFPVKFGWLSRLSPIPYSLSVPCSCHLVPVGSMCCEHLLPPELEVDVCPIFGDGPHKGMCPY